MDNLNNPEDVFSLQNSENQRATHKARENPKSARSNLNAFRTNGEKIFKINQTSSRYYDVFQNKSNIERKIIPVDSIDAKKNIISVSVYMNRIQNLNIFISILILINIILTLLDNGVFNVRFKKFISAQVDNLAGF